MDYMIILTNWAPISRQLGKFFYDPLNNIEVIFTIILPAIIALSVAGIAKLVDEKNDFKTWFKSSFALLFAIGFIFVVIATCA